MFVYSIGGIGGIEGIYLYDYTKDHIYFGVKKGITTLKEQEQYIKDQIANWSGVVATLESGRSGIVGKWVDVDVDVDVEVQSWGSLLVDPAEMNSGGGEYTLERCFDKGKGKSATVVSTIEKYGLLRLCPVGVDVGVDVGVGIGNRRIKINTTYNTFWCIGEQGVDDLV